MTTQFILNRRKRKHSRTYKIFTDSYLPFCKLLVEAQTAPVVELALLFKFSTNKRRFVVGNNTSSWRTTQGRLKNFRAIDQFTDWALLPSKLKRFMPKTIFKHKLKEFLLIIFRVS